jgi:tartrate/fumarate subfamily iron-sulfur-dependent hydro-lyase beta chain
MQGLIQYPFTPDRIRSLRTGDLVRISGRIFTARDRVHKMLFDGARSPLDLKDSAIYHCGPIALNVDGKWLIRAAGPTTSMRQEEYMEKIIADYGVRVIIGKGGMGEKTRRACTRFGCVYIQTVGGAAAAIGRCVRKVNGVYFLKEFGTAEAMWDMDVDHLEGVVTMDTTGRCLYRRIEAASRSALKKLLQSKKGVRLR